MEVKEYLKQTDGIKHHIDLLRIESQQLKLQSQSVQGVQYGEHISSPNKNAEAPFVRCLLRKQEVDDQIKREEDYLSTLKMEISIAIDELPCVDERIVLRARYINSSSWDEIANQLNYSLRSTHRIHAQALQHFVIPK